MRIIILLLLVFVFTQNGFSQIVPDTSAPMDIVFDRENSKTLMEKTPLTHDVYDRWESIGEKAISNNGKVIVYVVNPQEGDGNLYVTNHTGAKIKRIARGYNPVITTDNNFIICKLKPFFKDTREARIKKKKPEEMPKDSLAIFDIVKDTIYKIAKIKSFKTPEKGSGWVAYLLEKADPPKPKTIVAPDSLTQINNVQKMADSLRKVADSLIGKIKEVKDKGLGVLMPPKKEGKPAAKPAEDPVEEGTDLVLRNLLTGKEMVFKLTNEYYFDRYAKKIVIESSKKNGDSTKKAAIVWHTLATSVSDTVFAGFNDAKNYAIDEQAKQLAFVVEKDSVVKALQKFYKLYYYKEGMMRADVKADRSNASVAKGLTVSPDYNNIFSKDGEQLYFGLAKIRKPRDTSLVDFETARLDIWNYKDDYLQPQQLVQAPQELRRSFVTVYHPGSNKIVQLGSDTTETVQLVQEGNAKYVLATSTKNNRAATQWQGFALQNSYIISTETGAITGILRNAMANLTMSPMGKYAFWYDFKTKNYHTYEVATRKIKNISGQIKTALYDEEDDHPADPQPYGIMRWNQNDEAVYIYDRYDIWKCSANGTGVPKLLTNGRKDKVVTRWVNTDNEERFLSDTKAYLFSRFSETSKQSDITVAPVNGINNKKEAPGLSTTFRGYQRAKDSLNRFIYTCENPTSSPYLLSYESTPNGDNDFSVQILHQPNKQQGDYIWYDTELVNWKMLDGKMSEGILYKPENFDAKKKYPILFYFYERDANDLYNYIGPAPSASIINIPYFVSNGYIVFNPNIYYKNGEPGQSAYNSIVSAAKYLTKTYKWIDSTKMAIQGQSWGGYQVAYLVTKTNMFAAAGAGAPVSNMTSAYGGIRWGAGISRQFQYEKGQSRIGGTLWNKRDFYLKNSPLFFADKVKTPLLLMHNDKDGAVPWYQSIEFFTALKRLDKKVWLLQYNDEDHNLIERRNRKDLSIRLGQFFDHYLKGRPMPKWMSEGVPAVVKGIEWGLDSNNNLEDK